MTHDPSSPASTAPLESLEAQVRALQAEVAQARALFQDAPHATYLLDDQARLEDLNAQGAALIGVTPGALRGRLLSSVLSADTRFALGALLHRMFSGQDARPTEVRLVTASGTERDLLLSASLHVRSAGTRLCQLTATDVTAFKSAHQTLLSTTQQLEQDLERQLGRFAALGDEYKEVMLAAERELGTTLTREQNVLSLMHRQSTPDGWPRSLGHVTQAVQDTQGLLTSLKGYMQARLIRARLWPVDLNKVLREVLRELEPLQAERTVHLTCPPLPVLHSDHQVLHILLREYLANALKFTRTWPEARLHLLVREAEQEYWIGVQDNGVGFNMRQKDNAFELFGRLHSAERYEGPGLGLTVVRRLCERFGGRAWGEGREDQGATFWFAWPKAPTP
ncbi:sensor histidine kinase [Deinococcus radiotolerans]|uniref:histidine kinase n=1 Tax=Deinococcus radiotolerans TaxID=1309407 RepID=A0ABQ2FMR2_9DEIO|nr:sensor histidine kinase [Deinococcus radiotolerans]GGL08657.1 hypothetical protein GCM10010844_29280 [Deinococcus radiotolerans]